MSVSRKKDVRHQAEISLKEDKLAIASNVSVWLRNVLAELSRLGNYCNLLGFWVTIYMNCSADQDNICTVFGLEP